MNGSSGEIAAGREGECRGPSGFRHGLGDLDAGSLAEVVARHTQSLALRSAGETRADVLDVLSGPSMTVQKLSDKQLGSMIANYRARGVAEGGRWPLSELLLEERRRKPTAFPPGEVASTIIRLSQESPDGLVSYHDIWRAFLPEREWKGNAPRKILADALYRVIGYCVEHRLPILTVLVVRKSERRLSPEAVEHIYNESREMGVDVGPSPVSFVDRERAKALRMRIDQMPPAEA